MRKIFVGLLVVLFPGIGRANVSRANDIPIRVARVEVRHGNPVVTINGDPTFWACHYLRHYSAKMGSKWPVGVGHAVREFAARGIHRFEAQVDLGWSGVDGFDAAGAGVDMPVDTMLAAIIGADPKAQVVLRIGGFNLLPSNIPAAFAARYPGELEADQLGRKYSVSFASDVGFDILASEFSRLVGHVESGPWGGHVAGYDVFLEFEGVPWGSGTEGAFTDYSPAMLTAWRKFLIGRYGSDSNLQTAWGKPDAHLATAALPTPDEHLGGDPAMIFFDPVAQRNVSNYYALMDDLVLARHRQIARAIKAACHYKKLVGFMGGYVPDAGEPRSIVSPTGFPALQLSKQQFSGAACWGRAFDIPEIDFYFAPRDYLDTGTGGVCLPLNAPDSLRLHGKVAWLEDDQRTYLHRGVFDPKLKDARESIMANRRNAAVSYTECGATDWMEQVQNWLIDRPLLDNLGSVNKLLQSSVDAPAVIPESDAICVLMDEESEGATKPVITLDEELVEHQRNEGLSHCGVPVRYHLLSDLGRPNFPHYKFFVVLNAWHLTAEKEKLLDAHVRRDGNVVLWMYGAGYVGDKKLDAAGMERAIGMHIVATPFPWEHRISITDFTSPITRSLPADLTFGTSRHYGPIFRVEDSMARTLGRSFGFAMSRDVGLAIKSFGKGARGASAGVGGVQRGAGDYASIYCEAPNLPADLLRGMARYAGCNVYLESNDFLVAGKDLVMVHSAKPGKRTLTLPGKYDVSEWPTGRPVARGVSHFDFTLAAPGTAIFKLAPFRGY